MRRSRLLARFIRVRELRRTMDLDLDLDLDLAREPLRFRELRRDEPRRRYAAAAYVH